MSIGLACSLFIGGPDASVAVHLRILFALLGSYLVGAVVEDWLDLGRERDGFFPMHRMMLGQIALLLYFYVRSGLAHLPGVPGVKSEEILLVVLLAGVIAASRRLRFSRFGGGGFSGGGSALDESGAPWRSLAAPGALWGAWWVSTFTFVGMRSGLLQTPSSDPDGHAFFAKVTAAGGQIVDSAYPSAFAVLNAVWVDLTGAGPVAVINSQSAIQGSLAAGLIVEALIAIHRRVPVGASLLVIAAAHWIFVLPTNGEFLYLDHTPRLCQTAFAILPLTFALRLSAAGTSSSRRLWNGLFVLSFCSAWAPVSNPALAISQAPISLATLVLLAATRLTSVGAGSRRASTVLIGLTFVAPLVLIGSDAWFPGQIRARFAPPPAAVVTPVPQQIHWGRPAIDQALTWTALLSTFGLFPQGCVPGTGRCPAYLVGIVRWVPVILYGFALLYALHFIWRRRAGRDRTPTSLGFTAFALGAVGLASWVCLFLAGFMTGLIPEPVTLFPTLLREYAVQSLLHAMPLLFLLALALGIHAAAVVAERGWERLSARSGLASSWLRPKPDLLVTLLVVVGCLTISARNPRLHSEVASNFYRLGPGAPVSALGLVEPMDLEFVRRAQELIPNGESVVLPGVMFETRFESWNHAVGSSRAMPLYSDAPFAFFLGFGVAGGSATAYRDRVCESFDVPWLVEHGMVWLFLSGSNAPPASCLYNWEEIYPEYYEEKLRVADRVLYRLRDSLRGDNAPTLYPPRAPEAAADTGGNVKGWVDACTPEEITGWACDDASNEQVTVELELSGATGQSFRMLDRANQAREAAVGFPCGDGKTRHGFEILPPYVPSGLYRARVRAFDATGRHSEELPSAGGTCSLLLPRPRPPEPLDHNPDLRGMIASCDVSEINGWACDVGVDTPVRVELELHRDGVVVSAEHLANLVDNSDAQEQCGGESNLQGFRFRPPIVPPGRYRASVRAFWDGDPRRVDLPTSTGTDCVLDFAAPAREPTSGDAANLKGFLDGCSADEITGWACRVGSEAPLIVGAQLMSYEDRAAVENLLFGMSLMQQPTTDWSPREWSSVAQSFLAADLPREPIIAARCGTAGSRHGFRMPLPPGDYHVRVIAYDNWDGTTRELGRCLRRERETRSRVFLD
jgi:hypothetical protein